MKTTLALTALTLASVGLAGCAANPGGAETAYARTDRGPGACFRPGDIINVNIIDERTLYVATRRGNVYRLDAPSECYVQGGSVSVAPLGGGTVGDTCAGSQARVAVGGGFRFPSKQCLAQITGPYTDSRETGLWARPVAP